MNYLRRLILQSLLICLCSNALFAAELRTRITRADRDRLYFPVGLESHVYENARFTIYHGTDSVFSGWIDHAWQGVSISNLTDRYFDSLTIETLEAVIETATLDTVSLITVGTDIAGLQLVADTTEVDRAELRSYDDTLSMLDDFHNGLLDGIIRFRDLSPKLADVSTLSGSLPYLVVLVPNIGSEANYQGQLTTSLYYRFDQGRLAVNFDGDQAVMIHRFPPTVVNDKPARRLFAYDPARGRRLFEELTFKPKQVSLYAGHPALDGLALYFADIISRDRCPVKIVDDRRAADVRVEIVPVSQAVPAATVYTLFHTLVTDSLSGRTANEHVRRIASELRFVESPPRPGDYYRHLEISGRIMIEELGVFPLFRPTVFLHRHQRLQQVVIDPDGRFDFSRAILIDMPSPPEVGE